MEQNFKDNLVVYALLLTVAVLTLAIKLDGGQAQAQTPPPLVSQPAQGLDPVRIVLSEKCASRDVCMYETTVYFDERSYNYSSPIGSGFNAEICVRSYDTGRQDCLQYGAPSRSGDK